MKVNRLSAAIGFALIDHDFEQARGRRAMSTATPAEPSAIGPHPARAVPRGGGAQDAPDHTTSGNREASGDV
jgi:hypothetical protein